MDFDARRLRYLECLAKRAFLGSKRFASWKEKHSDGTLCDAIAALGLEKLDPGLQSVEDMLDRMPDFERDAQQHEWLLSDTRETALARALLARVQPERQDELFGWERAGVSREEYWAKLQVPTVHMQYLLETADFGAHEVLRLVYMLDETPAHLQEAALLWRDPDTLGRDPNYPESVASAVRSSFTDFKYWFDDPFRCYEFTGETERVRESKSLNGHEDMKPGQDMTYWSENHRILFAAAEYLAGQFWPDDQFISQRASRKEGPDGPPRAGDVTGREHQARGRLRVLRWLNERLRQGFAEWNAPGYYVEDLLALMNLADFAVDPEIRTRTAMVLDLLVFDLALNSPTGAFAGSAGRVYFEHKNCVWEQSVRDSAELLFGKLGHFSGSSAAAVFIATSPAYRPPDVLIALARRGPERLTALSRVSINFDEAADFGIGTTTIDDMEFWWSRAAYATKQTIIGTRQIATQYGLLDTPPFSAILPVIEKIADAIDTAEDVGAGILGGVAGALVGAVAGPVGALALGAAGAAWGASAPDFTEVDAADMFSVLTEGSVLSRANLYSHRSGGATLSSVQNFRRGQLNFQSMPCVAALAPGAMVWTSYPSTGTRLQLSLLFGAVNINEEIFPADHDGPNWWTGNAVQPRVLQRGGAAITAYRAQKIQNLMFGQRTHAWFPKNQFDEVRGPESARCNHDSARWFFGRCGDNYVGLFCALEGTWTENGPWKDKEIRVNGDTNVFITQIGCAAEFGNFERFMAKVSLARVHISGLHSGAELECSFDVPFGERLELHYDHESRYGGETLSDDDYPRHRSTLARVAWQQDRYAIQYAARSLVHDVMQGTRTTGGVLDDLLHVTPLTFFAQNMGLLPGPLYKGIDRDAALGALIARLRSQCPDVVGLSEMWTGEDRERVVGELHDLYPYSVEGPHEALDLLVTGFELEGGGLLLLSRHQILTQAATVFRHCSGDDCLTNKGVLHARIQRAGSPCAVDAFLTHTQAAEPTIAGSGAGARRAVEAQIRHLAAFVKSSRDPLAPAMLFGDFNVDAFAHHDLYDYLVQTLGGPVDLSPLTDVPGALRPTGTSEADSGVISSFESEHPARPIDDSSRFGETVERLDYLFSFAGALYTQHATRSNVVIEQWAPGRDISDHYGIQASIDTISQLFPAEQDLRSLAVRLLRFTCLQTTSGPGADEVAFSLAAKTARGETYTLNTRKIDDVSKGTQRDFGLEPLRLNDPGDELSLSIAGTEIDDLSSNDSLGRALLLFDRQELFALLAGGSASLAFPVLRGDGGEYVVEVELRIGE
ncbi:hypothetical protein PTKU46_64680 [Paraburkholderia terrae]|uniref:endonuclease/exonuclease/phosphatase family protein n=1 Tax=Paraburkholderia terrae TaxID=311230 RepID=UPI0030DE8F35